MNLPADFEHPSWWTALGTFTGYAIILAVMTVALFLVPYGLFTLLA